MSKKLILLMLSLLGMTQAVAQESEYIPFVREGVKWVCYYDNAYGAYAEHFHPFLDPFPEMLTYFTLEFKGDTIIGDHVYKALHKYSGPEIDESNDTILVYLREKDRIVYGIKPNGYQYHEFPVGYGPSAGGNYNVVTSGEEFIMYDFNDPVSRYVFSNGNNTGFSYECSDVVQVGDKKARRYRFRNRYDCYLIEGVGYDGYYDGYTLQYFCTDLIDYFSGFFLSHVIQDGKIIYKGINYEGVMPYDGWMPVDVGAKTWVNERVIVNKGDTTRYYYTYHIPNFERCYPTNSDGEAIYGGFYSPVYYSEGMKADTQGDSIIAYLNEQESLDIFNSCKNYPLDEVISQNRDMIRTSFIVDDVNLLYRMSHGNPSGTINTYLMVQNEPKTLTTGNFIVVDPVTIGDFECQRWAILDEQGEVLAYLVEGIGFDSRDMGDLLTPFTRRPDADADYQEWCGLSHVIKDGEIIYKGLCYDAKRVEAMSGALRGDLNGDGVVNVTDVTLLIDIVLNGATPGGPSRVAGDMNDSGDLNITDVTLLIEQALMQ